MRQDGELRSWQDLQKGCSDPHLLLHHFLSGGGWGKKWGRLVVAWQARLSEGLGHLPLAVAEVAVVQSEGDPGGSEGDQGRGSPDPPHHLHQGDLQDQGLLAVGGPHQIEASGMGVAAAAAAVVAAAAAAAVAVALPAGAADAVAVQAAADAAAASSFAEPEAAAASTFPPLPSSFSPLPLLSFSCLPLHLCCPREEEQDRG